MRRCEMHPFFSKCRKRDSNPHERNAQGILSPSCLPFHHFGAMLDSKKEVRAELLSLVAGVRLERATSRL